jgi:hypothetical protein
MAVTIRRVEYFNTTVSDRPGTGHQILAHLAREGIKQFAFPEEPTRLADVARRAGLEVEGPIPALLVQGDAGFGAIADIHETLYHAGINIYGSSGVADGQGSFGYVIYVSESQFEAAAQALGV